MENMAKIGPTIRIKGEVTAREPLTIAGHVDGTVDVEGHVLTVVEGGSLTATVIARAIVISGKATGQLTADERIVVRETAVIDGELAAPSVSLADGAKMQGRIDTGERRSTLSLAS